MDLKYRPITLIILDGWGVGDDPKYSAMARAKTPFYDSLIKKFPNTTLTASGEKVGLPDGQMGNSEVGHLNIGAGRIVYQDYTRININIRDGLLDSNEVLSGAMDKAREGGVTLHLMGLLSDGGVHSDVKHLFALLTMASKKGVSKVRIHAFMDGRDTPPQSGLGYVRQLESFISNEGLGGAVKIATVSGRYFAMDRDNRWERVKKAYDAVVLGDGRAKPSASEAVEYGYSKGETDEFILPTVITDGDAPVGRIMDGDAVIFFNFRTDRTRELTRALALADFTGFARDSRLKLASFVCMTEYDKSFGLPVAFPPHTLTNILGEVISRLGLRQLRIAETEKYAHVTFFFNGGVEKPFGGEDRCLIPSPKDVATYDQKPQMSAFELTGEVIKRIESGEYDFIIMNLANPDMVGHTGVMDAAVKACEVVDECLSKIIPSVDGSGGIAIITADHGNAEHMFDPATNEPFTAHTTNRVPFIIANGGYVLDGPGILADVAPTILGIMGIEKPGEMTGRSLLK